MPMVPNQKQPRYESKNYAIPQYIYSLLNQDEIRSLKDQGNVSTKPDVVDVGLWYVKVSQI